MPNPISIFLLCAALQSAPETPSAKPAAEAISIDHVVAIVNQDIITYRKLVRDLKQEGERRPLKNASEIQAAQTNILTLRVKELLAKQAGQDMGADEKLVERNVQDRFERLVQNSNGVVGMSKFLQARDLSTQDLRDDLRERLYASVWKESITGEGAGLSARPNRDRYVRPGEIKFHYERALRDPESLRRLGGASETITLQTLTLDSDKNGGREATLALANELRRALTSDADMNELVRRYSANKENDGVAEPAEIARLRPLSPALAKFIDERPGDQALWPRYVSEPIVVSDNGSRLFVRLARIRALAPGVTPPLASSRVQESIAQEARESLDAYRLETAFLNLHRAAYVWPPEFSARDKR